MICILFVHSADLCAASPSLSAGRQVVQCVNDVQNGFGCLMVALQLVASGSAKKKAAEGIGSNKYVLAHFRSSRAFRRPVSYTHLTLPTIA